MVSAPSGSRGNPVSLIFPSPGSSPAGRQGLEPALPRGLHTPPGQRHRPRGWIYPPQQREEILSTPCPNPREPQQAGQRGQVIPADRGPLADQRQPAPRPQGLFGRVPVREGPCSTTLTCSTRSAKRIALRMACFSQRVDQPRHGPAQEATPPQMLSPLALIK